MKKIISINFKRLQDSVLMQEIADVGFDGIDLGLNDCDPDIFKDAERSAELIRSTLDTFRLKAYQVHLPLYNLFTSCEMVDETIENSITGSLKIMSYLDIPWGAFHPMSASNFDYDRKRAMADNKEHLKKHLETAEKYNVGIAVENIPIFPDCPQYRFFSAVPEDHMELVDSLNSPHIGICWDFGHANLMPYDKAEVLNMMGERIKILHVHSNFAERDIHLSPGLGTVEWEKLLPILTKNGFKGNMSLETRWVSIGRKAYFAYCSAAADELMSLF